MSEKVLYKSIETVGGSYEVGKAGVVAIERRPGTLVYEVVYKNRIMDVPSTEIVDVALADPAKYGLEAK